MPDQPLPIEQLLTMLESAPPRITAAAVGLTPEQLRTPPAEGEWSLVEILAHLRSCADVWGDYITRILTHDYPTIRAVSPRTYIKKTDYPGQEFHPSLQAFSAQRADLLTTLRSLTSGDWSRAAIITGAGKPFERTLYSYAESIAVHERAHLKQIEHTARTLRGTS